MQENSNVLKLPRITGYISYLIIRFCLFVLLAAMLRAIKWWCYGPSILTRFFSHLFLHPHSNSWHSTQPEGYQLMKLCLTHTSRAWTAPARVCMLSPSPAKSPPWRRELPETERLQSPYPFLKRLTVPKALSPKPSQTFEHVFHHNITCCF